MRAEGVRFAWARRGGPQGPLVHARLADRDGAWACVACGEEHRLVLCRGEQTRAHFRHLAACPGEGERHRLAKCIVAQYFGSMSIRARCAECGEPVRAALGGLRAVVEDGSSLPPYRLDVGILDARGALVGAVEVRDTHPVPADKAAALDAALGGAWFEVDAQSVLDGAGVSADCVGGRRECGRCRPCAACGRKISEAAFADYDGLCAGCDAAALCFARRWEAAWASEDSVDPHAFFSEYSSRWFAGSRWVVPLLRRATDARARLDAFLRRFGSFEPREAAGVVAAVATLLPPGLRSHPEAAALLRRAEEGRRAWDLVSRFEPWDPRAADEAAAAVRRAPPELGGRPEVAALLRRAEAVETFMRSLAAAGGDAAAVGRLLRDAPEGVDAGVAEEIAARRDSEALLFAQRWEDKWARAPPLDPADFFAEYDSAPPYFAYNPCAAAVIGRARAAAADRLREADERWKSYSNVARNLARGSGVLQLCVPFGDKDAARAAGAKWDAGDRRWFVDSVEALEALLRHARADRWLPVPPERAAADLSDYRRRVGRGR
jgi:hypothetical protein